MESFNHNTKLLFPASGNGDCIFCLVDKENGIHLSMMIDCHVFTPEIKTIVTDMLNCHLDFLVVTHIDADHIDGICNMLNQVPDLRIDHIIYNNLFVEKVEDTQIESLTDFEKGQINKLRTLIPAWKPRAEYAIAAKESLALSTLIQRNWANAWDKNPKIVNGEYISLGGLGNMFIVSPTQTAIDELNEHFRNEFARNFYKKYPLEKGIENGAELFELLNLLYNQKDILLETKISTSTETLKAEYKKGDREDASKTNRSSIAFVWEVDEKRILLLGDASSDIVIDGIKAYKKTNQIPLEEKIIFDAIKVSHHGSEANLSKKLLTHIDSQNWIFCGSTDTAPHIHTVANIVYQPISDLIQKRRLYFNSRYYKNDIYNKIKAKATMLNAEGIEIEVLQINEITL